MIRERTDADLAACATALRGVHESDRYPHSWPHDPIDWLRPPRQRRAWVAVGRGDVGTDAVPTAPDPEASEIAGHVAVNLAEGDPALEVSSRGTGLPAELLLVVSRLFVVSAYRRRGLARALLDEAVAHAHGHRLRPVLDVLEADRGAIAFYERAGWQRVGAIVFRSRDGEPLPGLVYAGPEAAAGVPSSPSWAAAGNRDEPCTPTLPLPGWSGHGTRRGRCPE